MREDLLRLVVDASPIRTISDGKERSFAAVHDEAAWPPNLRGRFFGTAL